MKRAIIVCIILSLVTLGFGGCVNATPAATAQPATPPATPSPTASPVPTPAPTTAPRQVTPRLFTFTIDSAAIAGNLIVDNPSRTSFVLLPKTYADNTRRYPVVYFFNGFSNTPGSFAYSQGLALDKAVPAGQEFIVVDVDMHNANGGSFGVNSPVTGNWEDYLLREVIPYVDANFRTVAQASSRGICGFSMGGYIALHTAMKHPDVFCATYALCPGVFDETGLADAMKTWDSGFLKAYGQAFCPMPGDKQHNYEATPAMDGSEADKPIVESWESGFGDLPQKIDAYIALKTKLKAIGIEYGTQDSYGWIPKGCVYLSKLLDQAKILYSIKSFTGGHTIPINFTRDDLAPFFVAAFGK